MYNHTVLTTHTLTTSTFIAACIVFGMLQPTTACSDEDTSTTTENYSTEIQLSEVYPAPASDEEEFIELRNTDSVDVDLSGWSIADASGKKYTIASDDFTSTTINNGEYFVIPQSTSKIYLNNDGDTVYLYQPDDTLLDETTYEDAESAQSWSQTNGLWDWSTEVTEATENISVSVTNEEDSEEDSKDNTENNSSSSADAEHYETSDAVALSEMIPNPAGVDSTDEWIEIVNTGSTTIHLEGWQLTDTTSYYTIGDISIAPEEYIVFEVGDTGISLNNSGDTVYLIDPYNTIINGTEYTSSTEGFAWANFEGGWQWTEELTPGEVNIASESTSDSDNEGDDNNSDENDLDVLSISYYRSLEDGQSATIEGVVTVLPGTFGSQYFYIQDDEAGIQVYSYSKDFPDLSIGDRVRVTGEKSTTRNETRIKSSSVEDFTVLANEGEPTPRDVSTLEESFEGMLVQTEGQVVESSSSDALIDDLVKIVMKSSANIDADLLEVGNSVAVIGIVGQYDDEYRLMPRSNEDITAVESDDVAFVEAAEASTGISASTFDGSQAKRDQGTTVLVVLIVGLLTIIGGAFIRKKLEEQKAKNGQNTGASVPSVKTIFDNARSIQKK